MECADEQKGHCHDILGGGQGDSLIHCCHNILYKSLVEMQNLKQVRIANPDTASIMISSTM